MANVKTATPGAADSGVTPNTVVRQIVQVCAIPSSDGSRHGHLIGLCSDGTLWKRNEDPNHQDGWALYPSIPQGVV